MNREIKEHKVPQRSDEWFELRCGKITGSHFNDLMKKPRSKSATWSDGALTYLNAVASEMLTGVYEEPGYISKPMQWGIDCEPFAVQALSDHIMVNIRDCGIFELTEAIASSPDGILCGAGGADIGTIEIKCPTSAQHFLYYRDKSILWNKYKYQLYGHMLCTGHETGFLASFDPRMPEGKQLVICEPPEGYKDDIKLLEDRLMSAVELIEGWIK